MYCLTLCAFADRVAAKVKAHQRVSTWLSRLAGVFPALGQGDDGLGIPPYNGGLFEDANAPLLERVSLPDAELAPLIDALSREEQGGARRRINYRDLSVQHLGSIYERLLEQDVVADAGGNLSLRPSPFARKSSGSYYTPEELVRLILRRAVGPLLEERRAAFSSKVEELARSRRYPQADRSAPVASAVPRPSAAAGPPTVGSLRTFKVCANTNCSPPLTNVGAIARAVGTHSH